MTDPIDLLLFGLPAARGYHLAEWVQDDEPFARWIDVGDVAHMRWLCGSQAAKRAGYRTLLFAFGPRAHGLGRAPQERG